MWRHNRIHSVQNKGTHQDISEIFWFIQPIRLLVVVYHFNWGWNFDIECCLMGQHDALKKYWQSSPYEETLHVVISEDGGWITNAILMMQHQNCTQSNDQLLDIPVPYTTSQKSRHNVSLQPIFLTEKQQTVCWQRKNLRCMILDYHIYIYAQRFAAAVHARSCSPA